MRALKILEKILPLGFWLLIIFAFDTPKLASLTLLAALIHEFGHVLFGASRGFSHLLPKPHPTGFRISASGIMSYRDEIILLIGGPVLNLCVYFLFTLCYKLTGGEFFYDFALINLLTGFGNLFPIKGYDGYGIIESTAMHLSKSGSPPLRFLSLFSFLFNSALTLLSLYLILKIGEGYWIFALFFFSVMSTLQKLAENGDF